jgi:hypothetical protein
VGGGWTAPQIGLYRLANGERRNLASGAYASYSSTGHLLYVQSGTLMAAPFDLKRMEITGTAVTLVDRVLQSVGSGVAQYSISQNGSLAYVSGAIQGGQSRLVWVDRKGGEQALPAPLHSYLIPRISPDGKRVALVVNETGGFVWIYDLSRDALTRLSFEFGATSSLAWTRDSKRVVFNGGTPINMFWQPADGSGKAERHAF